MSDDKKDNIIDFVKAYKSKYPNREISVKHSLDSNDKDIKEGEEYFDNLIQFQSKVFNAGAKQTQLESSFDKKSVDASPPELKVLHSEEELSSSSTDQQEKKSSPSPYYMGTAVAGMMCLMIGIFVVNNSFQEKDSFRGVASEEEVETEKRILRVLETGQRKISSIGKVPTEKDLFTLRFLKSQYTAKWRRGKLKKAKLIEGEEPVVWPSLDLLVKKYPAIFPDHESRTFLKEESSAEDKLTKVYELRDEKNLRTGEVEILQNSEGAVLSFHVLW